MRDFQRDPHAFAKRFERETLLLSGEIVEARERLPQTELTPEAEALGLHLVQSLKIASHRAEFTLFEAARAHAAADPRTQATPDDVRAVAELAVRLRRSVFMDTFVEQNAQETEEIRRALDSKA